MAWGEIVATGGVALASSLIGSAITVWKTSRDREADADKARIDAENSRLLKMAEQAHEVALGLQTMARWCRALIPSEQEELDRAQFGLRMTYREIRLLGPMAAHEPAKQILYLAAVSVHLYPDSPAGVTAELSAQMNAAAHAIRLAADRLLDIHDPEFVFVAVPALPVTMDTEVP